MIFFLIWGESGKEEVGLMKNYLSVAIQRCFFLFSPPYITFNFFPLYTIKFLS